MCQVCNAVLYSLTKLLHTHDVHTCYNSLLHVMMQAWVARAVYEGYVDIAAPTYRCHLQIAHYMRYQLQLVI